MMNRMWDGLTAFFTGNADMVLSLVILVAMILVIGAIFLYRKTGELKQPLLMVLLALIAVINVLIWTVPTSDGSRPIDRVQAAEAE